MARIFFDFEFIENGDQHPIIPISIGMVSEYGEEYYAEFSDVDWSLANPWVVENVKPYLGKRVSCTYSKSIIADEIKKFVGDEPEFWAYYADYDWVILCQLYGKMIDLPTGWPQLAFDLKQYMWHLGFDRDDINVENTAEHDALMDARWNMRVYETLINYQNNLL